MIFKASINPHGQVYLPKEIREELNTKQIEILGDARTIVVYAKGLGPAEVLRSLKVVEVDLEHRAELVDRRSSYESRRTNRIISRRT